MVGVLCVVNQVSQNGSSSHAQSDSFTNSVYHHPTSTTSSSSAVLVSRHNNDILVSTSASLSMDYDAESSPGVWQASDHLAVNADSGTVIDPLSSRPPNPCPRISSSVSSPSPGAPARFSAHQTFSSTVVERTAFPFDSGMVPPTNDSSDAASSSAVIDSSAASSVTVNSVCSRQSPLTGH